MFRTCLIQVENLEKINAEVDEIEKKLEQTKAGE